jgi:putative two-component system response regulator
MSSNIQSESPDSSMNNASVSLSSRLVKMKILVIDDEPANIALLKRMLTDDGYSRVRYITDARTALDACNDFEPDLILLDLMMPYIDGLTILQMLRTRQSEVFLPVLVLTADVNEETKVNALRAGATDFLLKPFDQLEVLLRIANLLEIRRLHIQLDTQRAAFEEALRSRMSEFRDIKPSLTPS